MAKLHLSKYLKANVEEEKYLSFYPSKFLAGASVPKNRLITEKHEPYLI